LSVATDAVTEVAMSQVTVAVTVLVASALLVAVMATG
jgi:hypothetical protein